MKTYNDILEYASGLEALPLYHFPNPSIDVLGLNYDMDIILYQIPKEILSLVPVVENFNHLFLVFYFKEKPFALYGKGKNPKFQSVKIFCQESWSEIKQYLFDLAFKDKGHDVVSPNSYIEEEVDIATLFRYNVNAVYNSRNERKTSQNHAV